MPLNILGANGLQLSRIRAMYIHREKIMEGARIIYRLPYELVGSNMYFISSGNTGIVIDPNVNHELLHLFETQGTQEVVIVLTHEHYDHTVGVEWLQSNIKSRLFCHKYCAESIGTVEGNNPKTLAALLTIRDAVDGGCRRDTFMASAKSYVLHADETFEHHYVLKVNDILLQCYSAPGHSRGSAIYIMDGCCVFTGDSLIQQTPTILKLAGGNKNDFKAITQPLLRSLDKSMMVYPGHEAPFMLCDALFL